MVEITLRKMRKFHSMTLMQLSSLSGISKTHICNVESGNSMPTIQTLCDIANALNVPMTDLFQEVNIH